MLPRRSIFHGYQTFSAKIRYCIEILDNGRNLGKIYHRAIENVVSGRVRLWRNIRRNKCQIWIYFGKSSRINLPEESFPTTILVKKYTVDLFWWRMNGTFRQCPLLFTATLFYTLSWSIEFIYYLFIDKSNR